METREREGVYPVEPKDAQFHLSIFAQSIPKNILRGGGNEDAVGVDKTAGLVMALDGMGGMADGEKASQTAKNSLVEVLGGISDHDPEIVKERVRQALVDASKKVKDVVPGGGTTATVVKFIKTETGELRAIIGHVGDSRAYLIRDKKISQVTQDDSSLMESGLSQEEKRRIQGRLDNATRSEQLQTPEEWRYWSSRNRITQYLGKPDIQPHLYEIAVREGDVFLLTTDGVHDNLTLSEIWSGSKIVYDESVLAGLVRSIIFKVRSRITGDEYEQKRKYDPWFQRMRWKIRSRFQGRPMHFRSKPDDVTAVAVQVLR